MTEPRAVASGPSFDDWAEARVTALLRFAYLVTGSQHAAEDAVQSALERACRKWSRVTRADDPDAYVRRMIVNEHVSDWRRARRRESPVAEVRGADGRDPADQVAGSDAVWRVCSALPRQQRAAVVRLDRLVPFVWLGSDLRVGVVDLGDGFVRETVEVNGSTVTVGSQDAELRHRILDSATGGERCLSEIEPGSEIGHDAAAEGVEATSMNVCVYRALSWSEGGRAATLVSAGQVGFEALESYLEERGRAPTPRDLCPTIDYAEYDWVVLELVTDDGSVVDQDVVHVGACPGIDLDPTALSGLERVPVTSALADPWLQGGIRVVVPQEALGLRR